MRITVKITQIETYTLDRLDDMGVSNTFAAGLMQGAEILRQIREGEINPDESDIAEIQILEAVTEEGEGEEPPVLDEELDEVVEMPERYELDEVPDEAALAGQSELADR